MENENIDTVRLLGILLTVALALGCIVWQIFRSESGSGGGEDVDI